MGKRYKKEDFSLMKLNFQERLEILEDQILEEISKLSKLDNSFSRKKRNLVKRLIKIKNLKKRDSLITF